MTTAVDGAPARHLAPIEACALPSLIQDTAAGVVVLWRLHGSSQTAVSLIHAEGRVRIHAESTGLVCSEAVELAMLVLTATTVAAEGLLNVVTYRVRVRYDDEWFQEPAGAETADRHCIERYLTANQAADEALVEYRHWRTLDEPPPWRQWTVPLPRLINPATLRTPIVLPHNLSEVSTLNGGSHVQ